MVSQTVKTHFLGGMMTHLSTVAWGRALLSADHRDDLQYGALLCHPQQQRGHLSRSRERHSIYLTIIHPGTWKVTIIKKVPSCNQLTLPEFQISFFFFSLQHPVKAYIPCSGDSMTSATNVTIFHIYMIFFMAIWTPPPILTHTLSELYQRLFTQAQYWPLRCGKLLPGGARWGQVSWVKA